MFLTGTVHDFLERLNTDAEFKNSFKKILKIYPKKDILCHFSFDDQVQFIYEVVIPFARDHGFDFCLEDIVSNGNKIIDDDYLEHVSGGINLIKKLPAGLLAIIQATTVISPSNALTKSGASVPTTTPYASKLEKNEEEPDYGNLMEVLESNYKTLQPISDEHPLNDVDAMIFATISYMPMNCVPNLDSDIVDKEITISQWYKNLLTYFDKSDKKVNLHSEDNHNIKAYYPKRLHAKSYNIIKSRKLKLLDILSKSPRYQNVKVGNFRGKYFDVTHKEYEQFAAVTFTLEDGTKVVTFRGTDSTLSGWREDFDLSWSKQVPAQRDALKYLEDIYNLNPNSDFIVTGHSKGGHLAVYSSFYMCSKNSEFANKLKSILNYDGPGLRKDIVCDIDSKLFDRISKKLTTFIPQSSIIGRIMGDTSKGNLVCIYSSSEDIFWQHDSLSWNIYKNCENSNFKFKCYSVQPESDFSADAISMFLNGVDKEDDALRIFVSWVFDFMHRNDINIGDKRSMTEIFKEVFYNYFIRGKSFGEIVDAVFSPGLTINIDVQEQESFSKVMKSVFKAIINSYWKRHFEMNKKFGLPSEFNVSLEKMVNSNYSFKTVFNTIRVAIDNMLTLENIRSFIKKIYGGNII